MSNQRPTEISKDHASMLLLSYLQIVLAKKNLIENSKDILSFGNLVI